MIKSKGILTISIISLFAVESAYAAIASSGYVDQQVGTKISEVVEAGTGNVVSSISTKGTKVTANKDIDAEVTSNKTTSIAAAGSASDTKYPSEKAVATALDAKQDKLEGEVLTNTATGSGSVSTGGANVAATTDSVVIGNGSSVADSSNSSVVVGYGSSVASDANNSSVFGASASSSGRTGVAIGSFAQVTEDAGVAVGFGAVAGNGSIALGGGAVSSAEHAIQLGQGENNEANTLGVGFSTLKNYKLLGSDGKIPAERLPFEGDVLTNTATGSNSLSTGGADAIATNNSVAVGPGSTAGDASVSVGYNARAANNAVLIGSGSSMHNNVVIGTNAYGTDSDAVSIGKGAYSDTKSVAIGSGANAQNASNMIAIGNLAKTSANYAIQLGDGTNSEANTLKVGLSGTANYKLLGSDGKIPAERLPFTGDVLTNTATGSNSVSTGGANVTTGGSSLAIGVDAATGSSGEVAVGAAATSGGYSSVAVGNVADATGGNAVAVGQNSLADSMNSTAVGQGAKSTATYAIQLGAGTNSEANTFSVGLGSGKNYKLLGSNGKIPADRLPAATASTLGGVKSGGDISISSTGAVSVVSALKAVQDANGANIAATYATKNSVEDLQANKVKVDWTTSNVNKVLVIGSDSNYPDVYGKVTVAKITENFLDNAIKTKLSNAVTSVATSGSGAVVTGFSKSGNSMTVTKSNVKIPVGSATATTYATIWVE